MNRLIISCFFCGLTIVSWSQEKDKVWSLQECMEYAIENNLQVKQQELSIEDADINIKNAQGAYLPNLNLDATNTWNNGVNQFFVQSANNRPVQEQRRETVRNSRFGLNSRIPIYNGLQNYNQLQRAKLQKIASQYNIESIKDNIRLNIANSYLQALLQKENVKLLKAQHEITLEQINRTQSLIDAGNLPKGDILQLNSTSAEDIQNITAAENNYGISLLNLKQQLNLKYSDKISIEDIEADIDDLVLLEEPIERIIANTLAIRNEVKLANQNVEIAEKNIKIAKGGLLPSVSGFVGASTSEFETAADGLRTQFEDNFRYNYGLRIDVPIFNRYQNKNNISRSKVAKFRNEYQLELTKQRVTRDVYQAFLDAQASNKAYEASKLAETANEQAYEYAKNRFEVGISNSLDFTQAKIRFQNSQVQLIQSKYDVLFKLKLLELYINGKIE